MLAQIEKKDIYIVVTDRPSRFAGYVGIPVAIGFQLRTPAEKYFDNSQYIRMCKNIHTDQQFLFRLDFVFDFIDEYLPKCDLPTFVIYSSTQ